MTRLESDYYSYMDFDPEHTREVLRHYVPMFEERSPVLELGCGRGEFLGLLDAAGVKAQGVDSDEGMVEAARRIGRDVVCDDAIAFLHGDPAPGPFEGVFCAHFVEHLTPDQVAELLAGVRRVLAPGGRFVAVTPNPANHPGPPPEYLGPEPVVHPPLDDLVERAMGKLRAGLEHRDHKGRATEAHNPEWAYELAHVVMVLAGRLQETTEALREVRRAHDKLVWGLYQSNETYVVARG